MRLARAALLASVATGCSVPHEAGFPDVAHDVDERIGHAIHWNRGGEDDAAVLRAVRAMLAHPITPAEAVQIALVNNPTLQATYEELMIAQSDVVQAGLLQNPVFTGGVHVPIGAPVVPHVEVGVEEDFLDVFMIPAKKRIAKASFEATKKRVGSAVLDLAYDVRAGYFTLQGAMQIAAMRRTVLEAATASVELARREHEAGNLSELDLVNEEVQTEQVRVDLARSDLDIVTARQKLTRLLGLWGPDAGFAILAGLPDLPADEPPFEHLESLAIARRLDVAAARSELQAQAYALEKATDFRWISGLSAGASYERSEEGYHEVGPTASLSLPIFDQGQARLAALAAAVRRSERRYRATAVQARSEVGEIRARVVHTRELVRYYRAVAIPLRERAVSLAQTHYGAMLLGVHQLLLAKQGEINTYREYIEAVRDYWIARSDLGRAVGGRLPGQRKQP